MQKYDKSIFLQISAIFGFRYYVHCQRVYRNKSSYALNKADLSESIPSEILDLRYSFLFGNIENLIKIPKIHKEWSKIFLVVSVIAFDLLTVNSLCYYDYTRSWQSRY